VACFAVVLARTAISRRSEGCLHELWLGRTRRLCLIRHSSVRFYAIVDTHIAEKGNQCALLSFSRHLAEQTGLGFLPCASVHLGLTQAGTNPYLMPDLCAFLRGQSTVGYLTLRNLPEGRPTPRHLGINADAGQWRTTMTEAPAVSRRCNTQLGAGTTQLHMEGALFAVLFAVRCSLPRHYPRCRRPASWGGARRPFSFTATPPSHAAMAKVYAHSDGRYWKFLAFKPSTEGAPADQSSGKPCPSSPLPPVAVHFRCHSHSIVRFKLNGAKVYWPVPFSFMRK
jgi:hypothetical protein